jgi:Ras-related GTP-binding protein A/B
MNTNKEPNLSKILLMGVNDVGKTSMRNIIFANSSPRDTFLLGWTHEVSESRLRFMGNLSLNLLDCGGQDQFWDHYFTTKKSQIFSNVEIFVYVVQADNSHVDYHYKDLIYYEEYYFF